jgi:hypothetical protein
MGGAHIAPQHQGHQRRAHVRATCERSASAVRALFVNRCARAKIKFDSYKQLEAVTDLT